MSSSTLESAKSGQKLDGIDVEGLKGLAETNRKDPKSGHRVVHTSTRCVEGFRNVTKVRDTADIVVSEPCGLLGDNVAGNPSEFVLAALASCISVGLQANAADQGITLDKIEIDLAGKIDISTVWGVNAQTNPVMGFTEVEAQIKLSAEGVDEATLNKLADKAMKWSPVVNTLTNPVNVTHKTTVE